MPLGARLRQAREQAGVTAAELSERTKIRLYKIEALENGQFVHLPDGVYLDGIVRAYAREVALDPEPLIELLHLEHPPVEIDYAVAINRLAAARRKNGPTRAPWKPMTIDLPKQPLGKKRAPLAGVHVRVSHIPPSVLSGLVLPLISLLAVSGWGLYLHERHRPAPIPTVATEPPSAIGKAEPQAALIEPSEETPATVGDNGVPMPKAPTTAGSTGTTGSVRNVSGSWLLATRVERSRESGDTGSRHGYELQLDQAGDTITGSGWRTTANGRSVRTPEPAPLSLAGTIIGDRLALTFTERRSRREMQGKLVLLIDGDGTLRGRFSTDTTRSAGTAEAHRMR
jgi:transcriptional regulator with XRE-family HTH domain